MNYESINKVLKDQIPDLIPDLFRYRDTEKKRYLFQYYKRDMETARKILGDQLDNLCRNPNKICHIVIVTNEIGDGVDFRIAIT